MVPTILISAKKNVMCRTFPSKKNSTFSENSCILKQRLTPANILRISEFFEWQIEILIFTHKIIEIHNFFPRLTDKVLNFFSLSIYKFHDWWVLRYFLQPVGKFRRWRGILFKKLKMVPKILKNQSSLRTFKCKTS